MRIPMHVLRGEWQPTRPYKTGHLDAAGIMPYLHETDYSTRIQPGTIIVWSDRKAYQVIEVTERPLDLWPEHFLNEWKRFTEWWVEQVMAGRDMGKLDQLARELGESALPVSLDASSVDSIRAAVERAADALDGIDFLVNSVGIFEERGQFFTH